MDGKKLLNKLNELYKEMDSNKSPLSILIDGKWGIGKTYVYKQFSKSKKKNNYYMSLFGINSIEEVKKTIIKEVLFPDLKKLNSNNTLNILGSCFNRATKSIPRVGKALSDIANIIPNINELTKDLYIRKAENLKSTINYENNEIIDENNSLSQIAQKNGLTEKQLLDYNNLKVKPDDYNNIQDGTKIAIPNKPNVNEGVTVFTDDKGNQKIIVEDNSGKTKVFYYNAEDYSLLEIDGNEQIYNRFFKDERVA